MFGPTDYVPVVRWKRAELGALKDLGDADREHVVPLLEWVPRDFGASDAQIAGRVQSCSAALEQAWPYRPVFVDPALLPTTIRPNAWGRFATSAAGQKIIPVVGLDRSASEVAAARAASGAFGQGIAIRLRRWDIDRVDLASRINEVREALGGSLALLDLIVDYGITNPAAPSIARLLQLLPSPLGWRTLTVLSGAFPQDLRGFKGVGTHHHSRTDWNWWYNQVTRIPPLMRIPTYGDYVTQHPEFNEPPPRANFSASIRYASDDHWVVMRGEGVFNDDGPGFAQWPANAQMLCMEPEFSGPGYSAGDRYIATMAAQSTKTGNAETWLRAGLNRHLTFVARQVANLSLP